MPQRFTVRLKMKDCPTKGAIGKRRRAAEGTPSTAAAAPQVQAKEHATRRRCARPTLAGFHVVGTERAHGVDLVLVHVDDPALVRSVLCGWLANRANFNFQRHSGEHVGAKLRDLAAPPKEGEKEKSTELLFWVLAKNPAVLGESAFSAGKAAGGLLAFRRRQERRGVRDVDLLAIMACRCRGQQRRYGGLAATLVEALKPMVGGGTIHVSNGPCLGLHTVPFYLKLGFNPSPDMLKLKALYDGDVEYVKGSENIEMWWHRAAVFDEAGGAYLEGLVAQKRNSV